MAKISLKYSDLSKLIGLYAVTQRTESRQFLAWFLHNYYRLEETDVDDCICDGIDDKSADGIYVNEQSSEIHILQSKISKGPKTLGDTALKEFYGSLSQFRNRASVENILATTKNKELSARLRELEIAEKVEKDYTVYGIFITNSQRGDNAVAYLRTTPDLILYDETELQKGLIPIGKTEPVVDEIGFDVSTVPAIEYPIGNTLNMVIAPIAASELVGMNGIKNGELFAYNVRQWLKKTKVNVDIANSIKNQEEHKFFPAFHNGITILCKKLVSSLDKIKISGYAVVNGCQSLTGLYENRAKISSDLRILVKFIQTAPESKIAAKITDHTNNQNGITARDLQSNNLIQTRLQTEINSKGEFCYRIKRGEHWGGWPEEKVIENELAARLLLAFDVKQPWSCHQSYKLFDELYSSIFSRIEVTGARVVTIYRIYQIVMSKLDLIENQLFARYRLTHFFLMFLVRKALETDVVGKQFCRNPAPFVSTSTDQKHLLDCIEKVVQPIIRVVNGDVKRRDADKEAPFDFKRELKSPTKVRELEAAIITTYQSLIDIEAAMPFEKSWGGEANQEWRVKSKEYRTFIEALEKILSVTPTEIKRHEAAEKAKRKYMGKKRGPKPSASDLASVCKD